MADDPHYAGHVVPKRVRAPGEEIWRVHGNRVWWSCELRCHGESYGWEAQILRDTDLVIGHRFVLREQAVTWPTSSGG